MPTSSAPELELSLISFAGSGSTATWQGGDLEKQERMAKGVGVGDYWREAIILNISVQGGH